MLNKCQPKNRTKYEKLCVVSVIIILKKVLVKLEKLKGIEKRCARNYKRFLKNHDACVNAILTGIKKNQKKVPSCFGINRKMAAL